MRKKSQPGNKDVLNMHLLNRQLSIVEKILRNPSPVFYTFISYLSVRDIVRLMAVSKSFRNSMLEPKECGYVFKNLSLNRMDLPFSRPAMDIFYWPWENAITQNVAADDLQ